MPTKSTGCFNCRKRKIRCDETRPFCNRCKIHGVSCQGYRLPAPGQVEFRDQTAVTVWSAAQPRKNSRGSGSGSSSSSSSGSGSGSGSEASSPENMHLIAMRSPTPEGFYRDRNETALDFANAMYLYASPEYLPSPPAEKQLIYETFMDVYLPARVAGQDQDAHFSFLRELITSSDLRPELANSLDAMSMVQVGSLHRDKNLLRQGVASYQKALGGLWRRLVDMNEEAVNDDYVLATVNLLANCEFFEEIAKVGDGWASHLRGQQQLLAARGPKSLQSTISLLLYCNMRHGALSYSLIRRKACYLGTPEWRAVAWRAPVVDACTLFYDIAMQVPSLLERYDELDVAAPDVVADMDAILSEAKKLEFLMRDWFREYQVRSKFSDEKLYELVDIDNFKFFNSLVKDRTLKQAFAFPNFMVSYLLSVYWDVMAFLRTMVQSLHKARHLQRRDWTPSPDDAVPEEELEEYVMNLCRCFPFFMEPVSSSTGQIGMFLPLRTAAVYFTQRGNWAMLRWCGAVRDRGFTKGMRPPNVPAKDPAPDPPIGVNNSSPSPNSVAVGV